MPIAIAVLGALLAAVCLWAVLHGLDRRAGIATTSEATLAAFTFLLLPLNGVRLSAGASVGDAFLLALSVPLLFRVATGRFSQPPPWLFVSAGLVLAAVIGQAVAGYDINLDVVPGVLFLVAIAGTPLLLAPASARPEYRDAFVLCWLLGSALAVAAAVLDASGLTSIGPSVTGSIWDGRYGGLTVHPNHLGLVAVMAFPASLWLARAGRTRFVRVAGVALALFLPLGVLLSGSRAALVALGVVLVLELLTLARARDRRLLVLLVVTAAGVATIVVVLPATLGSGVSRLLVESQDNQDRLGVMVMSLASFYDNPVVGAGFSTARWANNLVLQVLQAGGLLAAAGFAIYVGGAMTRALSLRRAAQGLGGAIALVMLAWLVDGAFQNILYDRFLFLPVALIVALPASRVR